MSNQPDVRQLISNLPCRVRLPENPEVFFARRGPLVSRYDDQRRFPRFFLRTEAALVVRACLPACPRSGDVYRIYVKDISRSSVAFLYHEQLFPRERADLLLSDGKLRPLQIVRCRRLQEECYEVVGHFITLLNENESWCAASDAECPA